MRTVTTTPDLLPTHPWTGLRALAVLPSGRPVWPVLGGADDDEGGTLDVETGTTDDGGKPAARRTAPADADDAPDDDGPDTDDADDAEDDWTPPSREEWERVQKSLTDANAEAKKHRLAAREAKRTARSAARTAEKAPDGSPQQDEAEAVARAKQEAAEEAERRYKPAAIRSAAEAKLIKAGLQDPTDRRIAKLVKRLDMDDIDVDLDTGAVDGLDDQIEELRDDFAELFTPPAPPAEAEAPKRKRAPRIDAADKKPAKEEPKSTGERHAARVLGGGA